MLVLASSSPRRRELLALGGFTFTVAPASIPEELGAGESAIGYVTRLAREKAEAVWARQSPQDGEGDALLVLGADTTVVAPDGQILEKPADEANAARMLRLLSGTTSRLKQIAVDGDPEKLGEALRRLTAARTAETKTAETKD